MSLATALLTPILGDASPWTPRRLFQLGEAGGVYDPSDLTAEKVAWRRNLLTWSEDFTNAAWTKTDTTITANSIAAPDGTLTADLATEGTAGNARTGSATVTLPASTTVAASFFLKRGNTDWVRIFVSYAAFGSANGAGAWFNLATGQKGTTAALGDADQVSSVIADAGNGWYRCTLISRSISTANVLASVNSASADGSAVRVNNATFYPWGAQLEVGPTATAYQRITDFTSDFLAAFPTHGLYQDAAGTTPVTALGQPVGLVIDSKTGGISTTSLIGNGAIGIVGTATAATYNTTTGVGTCDRVDASNQSFVQWSGLNNASSYRVTLTNTGAVTLSLRAGGQTGSVLGTISVGATTQLVGLPSTGLLTITAAGAGGAFTVLAFNEVPGVHAIQPTNSSRPLLDGRVNRLTFSEQADNAVWTKIDATISSNVTVGPFGTTTADKIVENTAVGAVHYITQGVGSVNGARYQLGVLLKAAERSWAIVQYGNAYAWFNLANGTIGTQVAATTGTFAMESVGSGWYRCFVTWTATGTGAASLIFTATADNAANYTGDGTSGILFGGADLRLAADAAYPYQRVAAATDYADVGVPRAFAFDGFDDSLYTASNMDLSGTDKVTVLAGVRKLSDAAQGVVVEFTSTVVNPGAFALFAPQAASPPDNGIRVEAVTAFSANLAPATIVQTGLANRGAPSLTYRVNGTVTASSTSSLGSGNFANSVLNIGRRNNVSTPFNGKAYQLIVRGALTDAATLAQAERYVGAKTGIFL